jgi:hypothetical protein
MEKCLPDEDCLLTPCPIDHLTVKPGRPSRSWSVVRTHEISQLQQKNPPAANRHRENCGEAFASQPTFVRPRVRGPMCAQATPSLTTLAEHRPPTGYRQVDTGTSSMVVALFGGKPGINFGGDVTEGISGSQHALCNEWLTSNNQNPASPCDAMEAILETQRGGAKPSPSLVAPARVGAVAPWSPRLFLFSRCRVV